MTINAELDGLFEEIERYLEETDPFFELSKGRHPAGLPAAHAAALAARHDVLGSFIERLDSVARDDHARQDELSLAVMRLKLGDRMDHYRFGNHLVPIDAEGGFYNHVVYLLPYLPFNDAADFEAYLGWLPSYVEFLAGQRALLEEGIARGVVAPQVIVRNTLKLLAPFLAGRDAHPMMAPFMAMSERIATRERLLERANAMFDSRLLPAYQSLEAFFSGDYLQAAPEEVGVSAIPNGNAWYENRIHFFTTLEMTPDEVYSLGESEVARIHALMEETIAKTGFEGSFGEFIGKLRTDPQFYPTSAEQLLYRAAWIAKQSEGKLPGLFETLYRMPFTVAPVPDAIAPNYTGGRYVQAKPETHQAGIYWVNTYNLPSRSLYNQVALTLHEAVPGHHLQISIARELDGIPAFRNNYYISAFGEGWGLYSEYLGEEMDMYKTPYDWFGRYTYEMWRACRLVVDVGMHYKGWTRQQAIDFLRDNTALSEHEVETEIDRYIGWPGQAVSYKIGELTIKRLRREAEAALGDGFDLRHFHEVVLRNGSIPLDALEEEVRRYIEGEEQQ